MWYSNYSSVYALCQFLVIVACQKFNIIISTICFVSNAVTRITVLENYNSFVFVSSFSIIV